MFRLHACCRRVFIIVALVGLLCGGVPSAHLVGAAAPLGPRPLIGASVVASRAGTVTVSGRGFTPGGWVYIALYDTWGERLFETRWVIATITVPELEGSVIPPSEGGVVTETFGATAAFAGPASGEDGAAGSLCGTEPMARAFDQMADVWSEMVEIDVGC
jgi:hypothetical protein